MAHDHIAEAVVVSVPERQANGQVRLPGLGIKARVGGHPALSPVSKGEGRQPRLPEPTEGIPQLAVSLTSLQVLSGQGRGAIQGPDEAVFMVPH